MKHSNKKKLSRLKSRKSLIKLGAVFSVIIISTILFYLLIYIGDTPPIVIYDPSMEFPRDEGSHEQMKELWTFSGFLQTSNGDSFGYHVTYSSTGIRLATFIDVNNVTGKQYNVNKNYADDVQTPSRNIIAGNKSLNITYTKDSMVDRWKSVGINKYKLDSTVMGGGGELVHFNIDMISDKDPVPIGDENGKTYLNESGTFHSYFQSDIDLNGMMVLDNVEYKVSGKGWIDHSWGDWENFIAEDWRIILSNGVELFVSKIYTSTGETLMERYYRVNNDGSTDSDTSPGSSVENLKYWLDPSDSTGRRVYSHRWRIVSDMLNYNLTVEPILDDQMINNWVGICSVNGVIDGVRITGDCYVNLVRRYASTLTITDVTDNYNRLNIPNDPVIVIASANDDLPIVELTLHYRLNNGTEQTIGMVPGMVGWTATIPGQSLGVEVEYWITAKDLADTTIISSMFNYKVDI